MLNYIWAAMIIISVVFGIINKNGAELTNAIMSGAADAVNMTISLMGIMCFWTGMMNIAQNTGITSALSKIMMPLIKILFPKLKDRDCIDAIIMNMTANIMGMSNAATPFGIKAMEKLNKYSDKVNATDDMCMFIVLNTASIQLIPSTVIALRQSAGSVCATEIILPVWICSLCTVISGVIITKINSRFSRC